MIILIRFLERSPESLNLYIGRAEIFLELIDLLVFLPVVTLLCLHICDELLLVQLQILVVTL